MIEVEKKKVGEKYNLSELYHIIELLRSPEGCPWDRVQTHETLVKPMIEEAYEAVDAINKNSSEKLCEELGDVLLQVIFHAILSKEEGSFDFDDVTDRCARKMLFRHTHVFGNVHVEDEKEALDNWEKRKLTEKGFSSLKQDLEDIPTVFPALMRAQKVAKKIRKAEKTESDEKVLLNENEFEKANEEEIGELLYALCKLADNSDVDAEVALAKYTDKIIMDAGKENENR